MRQKRTYVKPHIDIFALDNEISLMMSSVPEGPPDPNNGLPMFSGSNVYKLKRSTTTISNNSSDNNPFGGSSPSYD